MSTLRRLHLRFRRARFRWRRRLRPLLAWLDRWWGRHRRAARVAEQLPAVRAAERVLVPVAHPQHAARLARVAAAIAETRGGEVIVLSVVPRPSEVAQPADRTDVSRWPAVAAAVTAVEARDVPVGWIVLAANDISRAIRREARHQQADVLLLGWRGAADTRPLSERTPLASLLTSPPCDLTVVGGEGDAVPEHILVPMGIGDDSWAALRLACGLARAPEDVTALKVLPADADDAYVNTVTKQLREEMTALGMGTVSQRVIRAPDRVTGVLRTVDGEFDGIVMPAPHETLLEELLFGDAQMQVAAESAVPVLVVKSQRGPLSMLARWLWRLAYDRLPKLTPEERAEVGAGIRDSARPQADFFVMIALSSTIAGFGLLLDSPAVIIGAMLVAPLMAAVVGIGLGFVEGDLSLIRAASTAGVRGALTAMAVGVGIGLLQPVGTPGPEVLARVHPTLFDLGVALASGGAGAYALSRKSVSAALAGVAIAAALVPPLTVAGIGLAWGNTEILLGALLLYLTNYIAIAAAGGVMFLLLGFGPTLEEETERRLLARGVRTALALLAAIVVPLGFLSYQTVRLLADERDAQRIRSVTAAAVPRYAEFEDVTIGTTTANGGALSLEVTLRMPGEIAAASQYQLARRMQDDIAGALQQPVALVLTVIPTRRVDPRAPPTPTETPTVTASATASPTATPTASATATAPATRRPTASDTATATTTAMPTLTPQPRGTDGVRPAAPNGQITLPGGTGRAPPAASPSSTPIQAPTAGPTPSQPSSN